MLRQRLLLEEYVVDLKWIKGTKNEVADMLSRNDFIYKPTAAVDTAESKAMMHEMFVNEMQVPIDYITIKNHQRDDEELKKNKTSSGTKRKYVLKTFGKYELWSKKLDSDNKYRIWIPQDLRADLLEWYYDMLHHPGARRLEESVRENFTCPQLSTL